MTIRINILIVIVLFKVTLQINEIMCHCFASKNYQLNYNGTILDQHVISSKYV